MSAARRPFPGQGEIWFTYVPGQPKDPHQPRPGLIVSENQRNRITDDCIVIPIFSSGQPGTTRVSLPRRVGGIPHDSVLFCEEITTIDQVFLDHGPLGEPVPDHILALVIRAVRRALGELVPMR